MRVAVALETCGGAHHWARQFITLGQRFVKSEQQQAAGLVFRTRDLLVRQRTQLINAPLPRAATSPLGSVSRSSKIDRRQAEAWGDIQNWRTHAQAPTHHRQQRHRPSASKRGAPRGSWLERMQTRKPRMLVTVALANKMARIIWALLVKQENYRALVAAKA